jgi:hypothetical protein
MWRYHNEAVLFIGPCLFVALVVIIVENVKSFKTKAIVHFIIIIIIQISEHWLYPLFGNINVHLTRYLFVVNPTTLTD